VTHKQRWHTRRSHDDILTQGVDLIALP
jgi:hypothetical protein